MYLIIILLLKLIHNKIQFFFFLIEINYTDKKKFKLFILFRSQFA